MIEHKATWDSVDVGHYILDKMSNVWRVSGIDVTNFVPTDDVIHLAGADGKVGRISRPPGSTPVTMLILNTREILEQELGAKEVS